MKPITHVTRKRKLYYLHQGKTKTGKAKYYFSIKAEGNLVQAIPEGFEIYENPDARVFLRKIPPKLISDQELNIVEEGLKQYARVEKYIVDVKKKHINIFTRNEDSTSFLELLWSSAQRFGRTDDDIEAILDEVLSYSCDIRFVLVDKQKRLFQTQRYCYRASIDDWIEIGPIDQLTPLVKIHIKHIGQNSIYQVL